MIKKVMLAVSAMALAAPAFAQTPAENDANNNGASGNNMGVAAQSPGGNNSVRGNAFAACSGILNAAWNIRINAGGQAATNIAAQGTVNFGNGGGGG